MKKSYSFVASGTCRSSGTGIDARCIFFDDRSQISDLEFFDELQTALKLSKTLPDCVVILSSPALAKRLCGYWSTSTDQRSNFMARGAREGVHYVKSYYFFAWDAQGLTLETSEHAQPAPMPFDVPVEDFCQQGLRQLVKGNPVVQVAPAGHVFKHPSGTINKVFIQARELPVSEPELCFVGRSLCCAFTPGLLRGVQTVFVDTMSIYPFVREALDFAGATARIHSFHSYGALSELSPPSEPYVVVISASTTGGMARKLCRDQGFDDKRVLTLIDVSAAERKGTVLIPLDQVDDIYGAHLADGTETEIELVGEHFSSKAKPPRAVTLGQPHTPKDLIKILEEFGIGGTHAINHVPTGRSASKLVCIDADRVATSQKFQSWLKAEIPWSVSIAIDHIVFTNDAGSEAIAALAADIIARAKGARPTIIGYRDLDAASLSAAQGVLVVTAVAGDGGLLREISRDLREFVPPALPRHFLAGVGLPQTGDAWERLRQFLERNTTHRRYGFSSWLVLPIGPDGSDSAWRDLVELVSRAEMAVPPAGVVDSAIAEQSLTALSTAVGVAYNGFLPKSDETPLGLSDGFLFFGDAFKERLAEVTPATTYLAVSSVLQAARDLKIASNQLRPTGYESVVLAPENFLRFNDNLLQACILRAAHPSELDYSASPHLSTLMKEFLIKVFARHAHLYGAAALEFAAALATGRLKLKKADAQEVVSVTVENLRAQPSALLGLLLMLMVPGWNS
ncbi:hypothetical protein [Burkholderia pseudomallei]|uniref:hypothetical protein n=1 Tax=Burkholderia pseudomallei TaxID=28450 RepID=UPI00048E396D|nr:hypothetical protein [Burkholderia pseudomallei]